MANAIDLVTLADLKAYVVSAGSDDQLLSRLITAGSAYIQSYTNRNFGSVAFTETRDGSGGTQLVFGNFPVTAVSALTIDGVTIPASTGYGVNGYYFSPTCLFLRGYTFSRDQGNVTFSYTAGYATIPEDIRQACIDIITLKYRQRDRIGLMSKSLGGESITFAQTDFPPTVLTILNQYRNVVPL